MKRGPLAALAALALGASAAAPSTLAAQTRPRPVFVARLDATSAAVPRLEASLGGAIPLGTYARLHLTAGGGAARERGEPEPSLRGDAIARFLLDPLLQSKRGPYLGGGVSWLAHRGARGHAWLALVAGVELAERGALIPALEVGVGGGARIGLVVRRGTPNWR